MRGAPPVRMVCRPDARWRGFECTVTVLAAAVAAAWLGLRWGWTAGSTALLVAAAVGMCLVLCRRWPTAGRVRQLDWTGERWLLDGEAARPTVALDLGGWLLLHCSREGRRGRWIPLDLADCGAAAHRVRSALVFHAGVRGAADGEGVRHG